MSKLIIAAAGSGKTTYLVQQALQIKTDRLLITTFTEANEASIREKMIEINGYIPPNIHIQTWFSFLLQHGVKPYQSFLYDGDVRGLLLVNQKSGLRYISHGKPVYYPEADTRHFYFSAERKIYSDKLSKFVISCNARSNGLVIERIQRVFPYIYIDEIQDMAGYDLEIIKLLEQANTKMLLVGDPRQVTYHTHDEAKNKKYSDGRIDLFVRENCSAVEIDDCTLNTTYRNHKQICNLANALYPNMKPCNALEKDCTGHDGVFLIKPSQVEAYIQKYRPMQLRDRITTAVNPNAPAMNFGNSKGLTFDRVLIYPTQPMRKWLSNSLSSLEVQSRAKLYVAITRARFSVAFVDASKKGCTLTGAERWDCLA